MGHIWDPPYGHHIFKQHMHSNVILTLKNENV